MAAKKGSGKQNVAAIAEKLALPLAKEQGVELWDVKYEKIGTNNILTYIIDKDTGVDIDDCEKFSRAIDKLLDEADPISDSYCLEVSSPGMGRELRRTAHLEAAIGCPVMISLYKAFMDSKEFIGILTAFDDENITIETEDGEIIFTKKEISKIRLYDDEDYIK